MRKPVDLQKAADAVNALLDALGVPMDSDPELADTGRRVAEAWAHELLGGYDMDPAEILADATAAETKGMVVVRSIQTTTMCPHHLLPALGVVHVGYLPGDRVVGLGALCSLAECFARRFSLQEQIGESIVQALKDDLGAEGAGCVVDLRPTCVTSRGNKQHAAHAVSYAWSGKLADDGQLRDQFLRAVSQTAG